MTTFDSVDKYVREEVLPPDLRRRSSIEETLADNPRMLVPFERQVRERTIHVVHEEQREVEEPVEDEEDERRNSLPVCDIPSYTKFKCTSAIL